MIEMFRRNFDDAEDAARRAETVDPASDAGLQLMIEEARKEGYEAGKREGQHLAETAFAAQEETRLTQERTDIRYQLNALLETDADHARETEKDVIEMFLALGERLVPELLSAFGPDLAVEQIRKCLQTTRADPVLTVRASGPAAEILQAETAEWRSTPSRPAQIRVEPDPEMTPGMVQVSWDTGRLVYDLEAACTAVLNALRHAAETLNSPPPQKA